MKKTSLYIIITLIESCSNITAPAEGGQGTITSGSGTVLIGN